MNVLLESTARLTVIVLVALLALGGMKRASAALRHWVLLSALICGFVAPALGGIAPAWSIGLRTTPAATRSAAAAPLTLGSARPARVPVTTPRDVVGPVATGLWAAGALLGIAIVIVRVVRHARVARRAAVVHDHRLRQRLDLVAREAGILPHVTLLMVDDPAALLTWGYWRPRVMLPRAAVRWPDSRLDVVLRHEVAHIRRADWLTHLLVEVVTALHWFNPLVWIVRNRLRHESERACDDAVLRSGVSPAEYAEHLLAVARVVVSTRRQWSPAPAMARPSTLRRRIVAMLDSDQNRQIVSRASGLVTATLMLAVTLPVSGYGASRPDDAAPAAPARRMEVASPSAPASVRHGVLPTAAPAARSAPAAAQGVATIYGVVRDITGRTIAGATLALVNRAGQTVTTVQTDAYGAYQFLEVVPGGYAIDVTFPAFLTLRNQLSIAAGDSIQREFTLEVGSIQETLTIVDMGAPAPPATLDPQSQLARTATDLRARSTSDRCRAQTAGGCVVPPAKVRDMAPAYPPSLRGSGVAGIVLLRGTIGVDGRMENLQVIESARPEFAESALEAIRNWEFRPTTLNGENVETAIDVNLYYSAN